MAAGEREQEDKPAVDGGNVYLVFDYMEHDLAGVIESHRSSGRNFSASQVKNVMVQVLRGLEHLHETCKPAVIHRDLKVRAPAPARARRLAHLLNEPIPTLLA